MTRKNATLIGAAVGLAIGALTGAPAAAEKKAIA